MKKHRYLISDPVAAYSRQSCRRIPGHVPVASESGIHPLHSKLAQMAQSLENLDQEEILDRLAKQVCLMTKEELNDWHAFLTSADDKSAEAQGTSKPSERGHAGRQPISENIRHTSNKACHESFDNAYIQRLQDGDPSTTGHFFAYFGGLLRIKLGCRRISLDSIAEMVDAILERALVTVKNGGLLQPRGLGPLVISACNDLLAEQHRPDSHNQLGRPAVINPSDNGEVRRKQARAVLGMLPPKDQDVLRTVLAGECDKDSAYPKFADPAYRRQLLTRARRQYRDLEKSNSDGLKCLL